jgi:hypothetical protein
LEIEVSNTSDQSDSYQLEWYFISKKTTVKGTEDMVVFNSGKDDVALGGGASIVKTVTSKPFIFTVKNIDSVSKTSTSGEGTPKQTRSGDTYVGYLVLVKADGEILGKESNSSRFLEDEWLEKCAAFAPSKKKSKP